MAWRDALEQTSNSPPTRNTQYCMLWMSLVSFFAWGQNVIGLLEVNSNSLPSCFPTARDLNWFKRGQRVQPYLQNGLSNKTVSAWIRLHMCTSSFLAILNLWCCNMEKIINPQLPQIIVKGYKRHGSILQKRIWCWEWEHLDHSNRNQPQLAQTKRGKMGYC